MQVHFNDRTKAYHLIFRNINMKMCLFIRWLVYFVQVDKDCLIGVSTFIFNSLLV